MTPPTYSFALGKLTARMESTASGASSRPDQSCLSLKPVPSTALEARETLIAKITGTRLNPVAALLFAERLGLLNLRRTSPDCPVLSTQLRPINLINFCLTYDARAIISPGLNPTPL